MLLIAGIAGSGGCSHPIAKELRQAARKDLSFTTVFNDPMAYKGALVIWGGIIIGATNLPDGTEILVLETPLSSLGEPADDRFSEGRFIAKSPQFLDPEIYRKGRKLTVAGEIVGKEARQLGKIDYSYPVLSVKQLYLWTEPTLSYPPPYYAPSWYWVETPIIIEKVPRKRD